MACSQLSNAETNHFEEPTQEDLKTCRREADKLPKTAILVAVVSLCERYAYYGFLGILRERQQLIQERNWPLIQGQRTTFRIAGTTRCVLAPWDSARILPP